ncbi:hypothetical protein C8F04DRAFT_1107781 [Mycena alexandri]|uniref:Uncharacterized protein n=1 Tax=Mycena alexandri TaxID=1745969 RepID=A0AAD6X2C2_9AGAR|nr:hypothetical protein C8F04DRAFT_1107781 [Mycena alexandri]
MGHTPSIFEATPQEHALDTARHLEKQRQILIWPPETMVPPGHVLVQFYSYRFQARDQLRPDMEAVLPLEKSGALSLFAMRRLWGLETCSIIDPLELRLGFSADPNWLSADVVKELVTKHGSIKVIEPYASYETLVKRQLRHIALAAASLLRSWSILAQAGVRDDYSTLSRLAKQLSKPRITNSQYLDWTRIGFLILLILVFYKPELITSLIDGITPSACLTFVLAALFLAVPNAHAVAGLEDEKPIVFVLSG